VTDQVPYEEHQAPDATDELLWTMWLAARPYVGALLVLFGVMGAFQGEWEGALGCAIVGSWPLLWGLADDGTMHVVLTPSELSVTVGRRRSRCAGR